MNTRYAEFDWNVAPLLANRFERKPVVGDMFSVGHMDARWQVIDVFSAFGETRFTAETVLPAHVKYGATLRQTFERVGPNQWRAFQDATAPTFSL